MSQAGPQGFTKRDATKTTVLAIVTLGLYFLYWMWQMLPELKAETGKGWDPQMKFIQFLIPLWNLKVSWDINNDLGEALNKDGTTLFVMQLIPVVNFYWLYSVQTEMNKHAGA